MGLIKDRRARHFWGRDRKAARAFGTMLWSASGKAPRRGRTSPAWDVYLVFDPTARWDTVPPGPAFWMHQLPGLNESLQLDGPKLREAVQGQLRKAAGRATRPGNG
jgi:hypothetical protein